MPAEAPITYWLAFRLGNEAGVVQKRMLDFEGRSYVDFYGENDNGASPHLRTGHLVPFKERAYQLADRIVVPVELPGGGWHAVPGAAGSLHPYRTGLDWKLRIGVHSGELVAGMN